MWKAILSNVLSMVTPSLLVSFRSMAVAFREKARKTDNPWDDVLADFLCAMLSIKE